MARRSIGAPLTVGIVLMVLVLALAAGWQVLVWSDLQPLPQGLSRLDWVLLVLGTIFFGLVMIGLIWLCTWLVAEVRLNQRQHAFIDAVTHEMKTPLASFRLGLDTLARHALEPAQRRQFIDRMREDLDRLDDTVERVLAAARAEERAGRRAPSGREAVDLRALLDASVERLVERHRLSASAVRIECAESIGVRGERAELDLVFDNLLDNAVKYSVPPVEVRIRARAQGDGRVSIEIADNGVGIAPRELRKIFQRFYRAGRDVQRQVAGLGLGLFVVRSMVKRQGGKVVARSEGAGRGSRFVVTLRAVRQPAPGPSGLAKPRSKGALGEARLGPDGFSCRADTRVEGRGKGEAWPGS